MLKTKTSNKTYAVVDKPFIIQAEYVCTRGHKYIKPVRGWRLHLSCPECGREMAAMKPLSIDKHVIVEAYQAMINDNGKKQSMPL